PDRLGGDSSREGPEPGRSPCGAQPLGSVRHGKPYRKQCLGGSTMFSFFSLSRQSGRAKQLPNRPRLEVLENRCLLAFWITAAPMPTARDLLAGVLGPDAKVYAIGGSPDSGRTSLSIVEQYDPTFNAWMARASLNTPRSSLGAAMGADGRIYAVGGHN